MYQVVGDADAVESRSKTRRLENVAVHDLDAPMPWATLQARWIPYNAPDAMTTGQKSRNQAPADVARGPRNENQHETGTMLVMTLNLACPARSNGLPPVQGLFRTVSCLSLVSGLLGSILTGIEPWNLK